ncbi:MAG: hypothetical protein J7599_07520 [Niabella sp.]|nr:hypothetical protein [Niabella sp.]
MRGIQTPTGLKGKDLHAFIVSKLDSVIAIKKMAMKLADSVCFTGSIVDREGAVSKAAMPSVVDTDVIKNSTVINTCYWFDSHGDVHIPGIWNKSLKDNSKRSENGILLLQEHKMQFDKIIADGSDVIPYTKTMTWKELGVDFPGETEALVFDNTIRKSRNEFMFSQYGAGHVKNHSVGMRYVDIELAINTEQKDYKEYKERWEKYIDKIANRDEVDEEGLFWAIIEAKVVEGSPVPKGSNVVTPVLQTTSTKNEPPLSTHEEPQEKSWFSLIK